MLIKRLVLALISLATVPLSTPALANDNGGPLLVTTYRPPARATTFREQLTIPTTIYPPGTSLGQLLSDNPPARIPILPLDTKWTGSVPAANRKLANCIELTTGWDGGMGIVIGTIQNRCYLSLRIRASYGFRTGTGPCTAIDRMDGVMLPAIGRRVIRWQGSDDKSQTACIASIDMLGIPAWPIETARSARQWLIGQVSNSAINRLILWDKGGDTKEAGSGMGKVRSVSGGELCELGIGASQFGPLNNGTEERQLTIRWADVARVEDISSNGSVSLTFKNAVGHEAWEFDFLNFNAALPSTGFDGTLAMSALSEYCRAAEAL